MKQWVLYTIVAGVLVLFFVSMAATAWLKQPLNPNEDVMAFVNQLEKIITAPEKDWQRAELVRQQLKAAWQPVRFRLQFIAEKDDIVRFDRTVDELKASIAVHDVSLARHKIEFLKSIWGTLR